MSLRTEDPRVAERLLRFMQDKFNEGLGSGVICFCGISFLNKGSSSETPKSGLCLELSVIGFRFKVAQAYCIIWYRAFKANIDAKHHSTQ